MNERLRRTGYIVPFLFLTLSPPIYSQPSIAPWQDPSPHTVRFVEFQTSAPRQPSPTEADLASFSALQRWDAGVFGFRRPEAELHQVWEADPSGRPQKARDFPGSQLFMAILSSPKAVANIPAPALAMFALPHTPESWIDRSENPQVQEAARTYYAAIDAATARQAKAFESGVPAARVVRLRGAHYMFLSNAEDTLREMRAFLGGLNSRVCEARTRAS